MACEDFAKRFLSTIVEVQKSGEVHEQSGKELRKCQEEHEKSSEKLRKSIENLQTMIKRNAEDLQDFVQNLTPDHRRELEGLIPKNQQNLFHEMLEVRSAEEIRRLTSPEGKGEDGDASSDEKQASVKDKDRSLDTSSSPEDEEDAGRRNWALHHSLPGNVRMATIESVDNGQSLRTIS
ncbi:hypothetical protein AG0111_0g11826 [Alternaria gaisen]|uniref:Uncharacterized protein n=1 Tax=Alternaria gaisen TaxID=167740 RepID=A0ACB6F745_9PLEO|nr:hypothetical protein AG0111_0g11826 [Alternaria gaisen]